MRPSIPLALEAAAARAAGSLSRLAGRGGGTTLPGKLLWKLDPGAIDRLAAQLPQGSVLVSATNGKTTTTAMAAEILRPRVRLAHNDSGPTSSAASPPPSSAPAAPSSACSRPTKPRSRSSRGGSGRRRCCSATSFATSSTGTASSSSSPPGGVTPSRRCPTRSSWSTATTRRSVTWGADRARSLTFGIDDPRHARHELQHAADSKYCLRCGTPYATRLPTSATSATTAARTAATPGRRSTWSPARSSCAASTARRSRSSRPPARHGSSCAPRPLQRLQRARRGLARGRAWVPSSEIVAGLGRFSAAFGRFERITIGDRRLLMLLIKNPAGANEAVRTIVDGGAPKVAVIALNDAIADGRDVSWIWDVDFEPLLDGLDTLVATGSRAAELALRFAYGGLAARTDRGRAVARGRARPWARADTARRRADAPAHLHGDAGAAPDRRRRAGTSRTTGRARHEDHRRAPLSGLPEHLRRPRQHRRARAASRAARPRARGARDRAARAGRRR